MKLQLVILGNGFDLHCGLKSGYEDFFRHSILDAALEQKGFPMMKEGSEGFWETLLFKYYLMHTPNINFKWCDIETIIKNALCTVFFGEDDGSSTNINHGIWKNALGSVKLRHNSIDEAEKIYDSIKRFLFEYCMDFYYGKFDKWKDFPDQYYLNLLTEHLLKELHSFESRFCKYIKEEIGNAENEEELNESYIVNAVNLLAKITGFSNDEYHAIDDIIDVEEKASYEQISSNIFTWVTKKEKKLITDFNSLKYTNILNFNYTALFDILGVKAPCIYSNVHGKLCNKLCSTECTCSSVIFGIDDTLIQSQYSNSEMRLFSKTYRKMLDTSSPISILPPNNNSYLDIKFYGHSLSEADYSYFQSIFDFYDLYGNDKVSLIFYYSKGFEQNDEIYRLIKSYGKTLMNQEQGKNLIHKLLLENRLKIVEVS